MILLLIFLLTVFAFTIYVLKKNKALSTNKPCHFVFTKEWSFVLTFKPDFCRHVLFH